MTVHPGERRVEAADALPPGPLTGTTLDGRYYVEGQLGEGGMGVVYASRHVHLEKKLAIKVLRQDASRDPDLVDRFQREARAATAIGSEHIVDISDFGKTPDGSTYFVMEFLAGSSLGDVLASGPLSIARTLHVAKQICEALGGAHQRGIVHRDLKPDNVYLVRRGGDSNFVKVLDFGIAKVGKSAKRLTVVGQVFGTPHYMSPEQAAGEPVDGRSDIYALGVILYEMVTGQVPFDSEQPMAILTKHLYQDPIPPRQTPAGGETPPKLEALILRCLAKKPDDRPATMEDVAIELESFEYDLPTGVRASLGLRLSDSQAEYRMPADGSGGYRVPKIDALAQSAERDVRASPVAGIPMTPSIELGSDPGAATVTTRTPATTGVQARATRDLDTVAPAPARSKAPLIVIAVLAIALLLVGGGIGLSYALSGPDTTASPIVPRAGTEQTVGTEVPPSAASTPSAGGGGTASTTPAAPTTPTVGVTPSAGTTPRAPATQGTQATPTAGTAARAGTTPSAGTTSPPTGVEPPGAGDTTSDDTQSTGRRTPPRRITGPRPIRTTPTPPPLVEPRRPTGPSRPPAGTGGTRTVRDPWATPPRR